MTINPALIHRIVRMSLIPACLWVASSFHAQDSDTDAIIQAVIAATDAQIIQSMDAPDGSHRAQVTVYPCVKIGEEEFSYEHLDLVDNSTAESEVIAIQVINCQGLGAAGLFVRHWSEDGAYVYYTDARDGTPDGLAVAWVGPLWRFSTVDRELERLGQARISPDGTQVVLWDQDQVRVMPDNASEATAFDRVPEELVITNVLWLPDSSGVLYIQADVLYGPSERSAVTYIDAAALTQTVLLDTGS